MSPASAADRQPEARAGMEALLLRCADLGAPAWWFDPAGNPVAEPSRTALPGRWMTSEHMCAAVAAAALHFTRHGGEDDSAVTELYPGCRLILVRLRQSRRTIAVAAVLAMCPAALHGTAFDQACAAAGLGPQQAREALAPLAGFSAQEADRLRTILGWMAADLSAQCRTQRSLHEFGVQLSEMYEEIGLLYRLGRSMDHLTTPEQFAEIICRELSQTLPFQWIAVKFGRMAQVVPVLAGQLFISGTLPCDPDEFDSLAPLLLENLSPERWKLLPEGRGSELVALTGSPILAHPVGRNGIVVGAILAGNKRGDDPDITSFETQLLDAAADFLGVFVENAGLYADQHALFMGTLQALTASIDAKDRYTCGHSERVSHLAYQLALASGLDVAAAERVRISGLLHDVGKIGVPEAVLIKPGRLTDDEFDLIRRHPTIGHRILKDIPQLLDTLPGVLHHHERWDGGGYPAGLAGERIPLIARILAVADAFDAMSSTRSYRAAMPRERALAEIRRSAGSHLDPDLARRFLALDLGGYDQLVNRHRAGLRLAA